MTGAHDVTAIDENQSTGTLTLRFDTGSEDIRGWAAATAADRAEDPLVLSLMAGAVLLGTIRRDVPRPDVDTHLGYAGPAKGFRVAGQGLRAFARVNRLSDLAVTLEGAGASLTRHPLPELGDARLSVKSLSVRHGIGKSLRLADLWLQSSRGLSLRFDGDGKAPKSLDAYQCSPSGELVKVAADRPIAGAASILSLTLLNPFGPVLLVFKGQDRSIDAIDCLPFPSLARGGLHAAERLIASHGADDVADTATLSDHLMTSWLKRLEQPENSVTDLELDPSVQTGLEPAVDEDLLEWLTGNLGISVRPTNASSLPAFITERIARYSRRQAGPGHTLQLPADCIPTLAALLNCLPDDAAEQTVAGGMGIVDSSRHGPVWSVWQPPFAHGLDKLQAVDGPQFAPRLVVRARSAARGSAIVIDWPLALALREPPTRVPDNSPFETSIELKAPMIRGVDRAGGSDLDIVIVGGRQPADLSPLLESLAAQSDVKIGQILVCRPEGQTDTQLARSLKRLFKDRHSILAQPADAGRLEQIVGVRNGLTADRVAILDAASVLIDPRTLAVLTTMLTIPDVASVGCLLRAAADNMTALGAGYSLSQVNLRSAPTIEFAAIDPVVWRGPATYPVVANSLAALVTRRQALDGLVAHGSSFLRPEVDDLLMGIQLLEAGGINLCTTIVSAYSAAPGPRPSLAPVSIPYRLSAERLARIAESTVLVQRIA